MQGGILAEEVRLLILRMDFKIDFLFIYAISGPYSSLDCRGLMGGDLRIIMKMKHKESNSE